MGVLLKLILFTVIIMITANNINLLHILVIGPFLYFIAANNGNIDKRFFTVLLLIVYFMVPYHIYRFYKRTKSENKNV